MKVFAQNSILTNPINSNSLEDLFITLLDGILTILIPILVVWIVWIGFQFVLSADNPEKIKDKKQHLVNLVIGLLIVFGAKGILAVIKATILNVVG